ncbi:ESCO1/2 acetyl-transferase-domain-containing protein [Lipomyces japonicus]|uniref:ESCO1/2 acetyl-transferase-domain-containing protein n=1 Tax=Lipomyces japonicus TaxID=56871 RepID=UPI0034CEA2D4
MSIRRQLSTVTYKSKRHNRQYASSSSVSLGDSSPPSSSSFDLNDTIVVQPRVNISSSPPLTKKRKVASDAQSSDSDLKKQTFLSLGQAERTTCVKCGMSYVSHSSLDVKVHEKFHKRALSGVEITIPKSILPLTTRSFGKVFMFTRESTANFKSVRAAVERILSLCNSELSAPEKDSIWRSGMAVVCCITEKKGKQQIVGACLVEQIDHGFWMSAQTGRLMASTGRIKLIMGISRIYMVHDSRRQGIARVLLEEARKNFIYGLDVPREMVGWSQPSDSGARIATAWCSSAITAQEIKQNELACTMENQKKIRVYIEH